MNAAILRNLLKAIKFFHKLIVQRIVRTIRKIKISSAIFFDFICQMFFNLNTMKKLSFLIIVFSFLLSSCATQNAIKAFKQNGNTETSQISGIDDKSKIQWRIANDDKKLYFRFESSDQSIQRMLMFNGFTLIIDTAGRKNENLTLRVSNRVENENPAIPKGRPELKNFKPNSTVNFKEGFWKEDENETYIDFQFDKTDFAATYKIDSFELIVCNVSIPLKALKPSGLNALNKLSVGLKIGHFQKLINNEDGFTEGEEHEGYEGRTNGMNGQMGGGGMGRGMNGQMGRGMGRGSMGGGRHGGNHTNANSLGISSVEFWFTTELAK